MDRPNDHLRDVTDRIGRLIETAKSVATDLQISIIRAILDVAGEHAGEFVQVEVAITKALSITDMTARLVTILIDQFKRWAPLRDRDPLFVSLGLLAVSDTGIRPGTLGRIFRRLPAATQDGTPTQWAGTNWTEVDPEHCLEALAGKLGNLMVCGSEQILASLHFGSQGLEYDPPRWYAGKGDPNRVWEISDLRLRDRIRATLEKSDLPFIRAIHLLLADEAFQQYAVITRNSQAKKFFGLRYHRRLIEGIIHGIRSTHDPSDAVAERAAKFSWLHISTLPPGSRARISYLYCSFYRQHLEHAPDWWLTRMFGANAEKVELLSMFLDHPLLKRAGDRHMEDIATDAFRNQSKVKVSMSLPISDAGKMLKGKALVKFTADVRINDNSKGSGFLNARSACENHLADLGIYVEDLTSSPLDLIDKTNAELDATARHRIDEFYCKVDEHSIKGIVEAIDFFERIGVTFTHDYELDPKHPESKGLLKLSYLWFRMARALAVGFNGVERPKASGSSSRVFVRCCMYLAASCGVDEGIERAAFLSRSRQALTRLTFRMFRYPSERAAILILEAGFARLVSAHGGMIEGVPAKSSLNRAAELLQAAEDLLPSEVSRPRLRLRFLLERASLALEFAKHARIDGRAPTGHLGVVLMDLSEVKALAHRMGAVRAYETRLLRLHEEVHQFNDHSLPVGLNGRMTATVSSRGA